MIGLLALAAQAVSALPPAAPVSQPAFDHADVLIPIDAAFAAFEAGDGAALLRHVYPNGRVTAVGTTPSGSHGIRESSFAEFATKLSSGGGFRERISDPAIEVDGDIALVWAPFTVETGGKVASCGTDHFDLVRQSGVWKIMNITFSSRTSGCPGQ
ncbi:MAG: nuclear transport factor 2 family protein [Sphingomicrobium sp.]